MYMYIRVGSQSFPLLSLLPTDSVHCAVTVLVIDKLASGTNGAEISKQISALMEFEPPISLLQVRHAHH